MNDLLPEVDKTIDASGRTILPGLIDAHDHQTYHNTLGLLKWRWSLPRDQLVIRSCIAAVDGLYRTGCILNMTPSANKSVKPALPLEEQAP
jgi:imidazolonepropionase-like amidohydrolase